MGELVRISNLCKNSSKGDTTNWKYELYRKPKNIDDTTPIEHLWSN